MGGVDGQVTEFEVRLLYVCICLVVFFCFFF